MSYPTHNNFNVKRVARVLVIVATSVYRYGTAVDHVFFWQDHLHLGADYLPSEDGQSLPCRCIQYS